MRIIVFHLIFTDVTVYTKPPPPFMKHSHEKRKKNLPSNIVKNVKLKRKES